MCECEEQDEASIQSVEASIQSVEELLGMPLTIPSYQRPYQWTARNIEALLSDIERAIQMSKQYSNFKYRIGTILLHKHEQGLHVIDGQQRILSLLLLRLALDDTRADYPILNQQFQNPETQRHLRENYRVCVSYLSRRGVTLREEIRKAYTNILEVVVISVSELSEAFQLFDSQNSRGKALAPHDLLKAYHLREIQAETVAERKRSVARWEARDPQEIEELFNWYLFPIWCWAQKERIPWKLKTGWNFSVQDIEVYKGIPANTPYTYAKRVSRAMPCYQITEPFISGADFFGMVEHYLTLVEDVRKHIQGVNQLIANDNLNCLFTCALLLYYDRFHNFDEAVVRMLSEWTFMLRVDLASLRFESVNKYAIGECGNYSNHIPMFGRIRNARTPAELVAIAINTAKLNDLGNETWKTRFEKINKVIGGCNE